jgi:hypothetical protein
MIISIASCRGTLDTSGVPTLIESLAAELERPRELPRQVGKHLGATYGTGRDEVAGFLVNELPRLEDYEIDLILSPVFTPTLADQAVFAELLGMESVPADSFPELIAQLAARPTVAHLVSEAAVTCPVTLREVSIERYVKRLRLEGTMPEALFKLINHLPPAADRPLLKAIARRAVWEPAARGDILFRYLISALGGDAYRLEDVIGLLKLAESYEPADVAALLGHLPHWRQVLQQEMNVLANPKPFFTPRIEELHGGGRDQRTTDDLKINAKKDELAFLDRIERALDVPTTAAARP